MRTLIIIFLYFSATSYMAFAQNSMSEESIKVAIRDLEMKEIKAVADKNIEELRTIWAEDFMVNNPFNRVVHGRQEVIDRIESGFINYSSFEREIESIMILDDIVIVMGLETIIPLGGGYETGLTIHRRYTNIWKQKDGKWMVRARHANVICGNQD